MLWHKAEFMVLLLEEWAEELMGPQMVERKTDEQPDSDTSTAAW